MYNMLESIQYNHEFSGVKGTLAFPFYLWLTQRKAY